MNKKGLSIVLAKKTGMSREQSLSAVHTVFEEISDAMARGEKVLISGFGTYETRAFSERTGQNPGTGEKIIIKGRTSPKFKAGKVLKERVAAGKKV